MKKRIISIVLCFVMLFSLLPMNVFADGYRCPDCEEWFEDVDDLCKECHKCPSCVDICDDCHYCEECAVEQGIHCSECGTCAQSLGEDEIEECCCVGCGKCPNCVGDICDYCYECDDCAKGVTHCKECGACINMMGYDELLCCANCGRCPDCSDFSFDTEINGDYLCDDCLMEKIEEYTEGAVCEECGAFIAADEVDSEEELEMIEELFTVKEPGECGVHCIDCYDENHCEICDMCFLCEGDDMQCPSCGLCYDCALDDGRHCEICGECFEEAEQCQSGGNHCVFCCENEDWLCDNCGACCEALGLERCEDCRFCENCIEDNSMHCTLCDECYCVIDRCADDGEHCIDCCYSEGWLCENCGQCTEALGIEKCEYCDYCIDCCNEFTIIEGGEEGHCLMNDDEADYWRDIEENGSMTGNRHIGAHQLLYTTTRSSHQGYCTVRGCLYKGKWEEHTFADKKVLIPPTKQQDGKIVKVCTVCGYQSAVETVRYGENFEISNRYYTVTVPKVGAHPDTYFRGGGKSAVYDEILTWQQPVSGKYVDMKPTDTFKAGAKYAAVITIVPKSGITVSPGNNFKVLINDEDVTDTKSGLSFTYFCTPKVVEEIETVELVEISVPGYRIGGNVADAVPTVDTEGVSLLSYTWMSGSSYVTAGQFKEGKEYVLSLNINAEKGYEIKRYCDAIAWISDAGFSGGSYGGGTEGGVHYDAMVMFWLPKLIGDGTKTVSGKVTSYGKSSEATVIQLFASGSGEVAYETIVTGLTADYTVSGVAAGTYTMKVSKAGHAPRQYTVSVSGDTVQNCALRLYGDIDGDGDADAEDLTLLARYIAKLDDFTPDQLAAADVDGTPGVDSNDLTRLARHVAKLEPLY